MSDDTNRLPAWLSPAGEDLERLLARGQTPQGILIHGPRGTGRRFLAIWLASQLLGLPLARLRHLVESAATDPEEGTRLDHPDLLVVRPAPEKQSISVDQVRELTAFLQLKSHRGGARVVLVWPAEAMTPAAANSLLKTLEEPQPGSTIALVAESPGQLPPTIVSRCHRLRVRPPERVVAERWLAARDGNADWGTLLEFAGGAPLRALELDANGFHERAQGFAGDLGDLERRQSTPVAVARRWADADRDMLLLWLYMHAAQSVRTAALAAVADSTANARNGPLQNPGKRLTMRTALDRLRDIEELRRNEDRSLGPELQLSALLHRWYGGSTRGDEA